MKNKLGIIDPSEMDRVEAQALIKATDEIFHEYDTEHQFTADDICHMHRSWLGGIYEWLDNIVTSTSARMILPLQWRLKSRS